MGTVIPLIRKSINFNIKAIAVLFTFFIFSFSTLSYSADIVITFCPVTKIQANKQWGGTMTIQNNSGQVLDLSKNKFTINWPTLSYLQWPFSSITQTGNVWNFIINLNFPGTIAVGATTTLTVAGNNFTGMLEFPTSGVFTQDGKTYTVEIRNCNDTQNYEIYDSTFAFKRECFIYSPPKICLGQAATEIWRGEGVFDAMIPVDRPSWAIAVMVAHRIFTNLVRYDIVSPNFWTATAMNESRMTCDTTIKPNRSGGHFPINGRPNDGQGVYSVTDNCFQLLNVAYLQLEYNHPNLFAQTNNYGKASYATVMANGNWEASALAMAYYHFDNLRYWSQIYCFDLTKTWQEAKDPYAMEKIFYHAYHDGPNAALSLLNDIKSNYAAAVAAKNMNDIIKTGGTWSNIIQGGSSQKVGNFTYLLDGNHGTLYPYDKKDTLTQFLGCYNAPIKWSDILYYLNKIKIIYPKLQQASVQSAIKVIYDGINAGSNVNFEDLGKVIDEIVIQMGGNDPSKYIASQFGGAKTCTVNPLGVALRVRDTICPGTQGQLQVWLSGAKNFKFTLKYPDGSTKTFDNVDYSPFIVPITQPGDYEIISFQDSKELGTPNCLFSKITVKSKNGNIINWDKSTVNGNPACTPGPLVIKNSGTGSVTVTYTHNGAGTQTVTIPVGTNSVVVSNTPAPGQYIITKMLPNSCGTPVNDTINICSCILSVNTTLKKDASCNGLNNGIATVSVTAGTGPYTYKWSPSGGTTSTATGLSPGNYTVTISGSSGCSTNTTLEIREPSAITSSVTSTPSGCKAKTGTASVVKSNGGASSFTYKWSSGDVGPVASNLAAGIYTVTTTDANGCMLTNTVSVGNSNKPLVAIQSQTDASCNGSSTGSVILEVTDGVEPYSYQWIPSGGSTSVATGLQAGTYTTIITDALGCSTATTTTVNEPKPIIASTSSTPSACKTANGTATVSISSGGLSPYTYSWSSGATGSLASNLTAGIYSVQITDSKGCTQTTTVTVDNINSPVVTLQAKNNIRCNGEANGRIDLSVNGGASPYTFTWIPAGGSTTVATGLSAGTYTSIVTDNMGCQKFMVIPITEPTAISANIISTSVCDPNKGSAKATITGGVSPYTYNWLPSGGNSSSATGLSNGTYTVTVTDSNSCTKESNINVSVMSLPTITTSGNINIVQGQSVVISATGGGSYLWVTGEIGSSITVTPRTTTVYCVKVTAPNTCADTACLTVSVEPVNCHIAFPNAFSPNGDGENDILKLNYSNLKCIEKFRLKIYDRYGENIFETDKPEEGWDGFYKGKPENTGVFSYYFEYSLSTGESGVKKGNVSLIK